MPLLELGQINLVRHQCIPLGLGLGCGAEGADGFKIIIYLQACPLRRLDDRIEEGRGVSTVDSLAKKPVFPTKSKGFGHTFRGKYAISHLPRSDNPDPLGIEEIFLYNPPHITQRITAQRGLFTVHNNPSTPIAETSFPEDTIVATNRTMTYYTVDTIVIKKEFKKEFKRILSLYGWNQATIYPGLDGITSHLDWLMTEVR